MCGMMSGMRENRCVARTVRVDSDPGSGEVAQ
jgi:hypothetical protein